MTVRNFIPADHVTVTLACTTSSGSRQFQSAVGVYESLRIVNLGPDVAYMRFGTSAPTATIPSGSTVGDMAIPVGDIEVFPCEWFTYIGAICPTSTATLVITPGRGQ